MDKLKMRSENLVDENIDFIAKKFPNAIVEARDENGNLSRMVDFDILKQELSKEIVESDKERYQMTWPGKKQAILTANAPVAMTLRPCKEESVDFNNTQNIYIEGDNLDVLKVLRETYLGKVKMIYIDPPYNTGNDFVYNDDFATDTNDYLERSNQVDDQGNRMSVNSESNGRFHSDWLNMMYPRLKIAKDLLSDDGIIFISIDDNEYENLKKICDEIFGSFNFISNIIWYKNNSKGNVKQISNVTEYILCFAKNIMNLPVFEVNKENARQMCIVAKEIFESTNCDVEKTNEKFRKWMREQNIEGGEKKYNKVDENGRLYTDKPLTAPGSKLFYDIIHPVTKKVCKTASRGWAYKKESFDELLASGHILFGKDETTCPYLKYYLDENLTQSPTSHIQVTANNAVDMQILGFSKEEFSYPKPVALIKQIINFYPQKNFTILDFFSGSATTAHAVMQLNAEDYGTRKFIMVQLPEKCDEKSEAYKAGYKTICDIGEERIRRAGTKIKEENPNAQNLDIGFRVFKLDSSNMKDTYYEPNQYSTNLLDQLDENIKPDRTPEDLLFQVMLDLGLMLDSKIEEKIINGKKVFVVGEYNEAIDPDLICCFDSDVDNNTVTEIAKLKPRFCVFRDSSMAKDSVATNFDQIFETYSPSTTRKVL